VGHVAQQVQTKRGEIGGFVITDKTDIKDRFYQGFTLFRISSQFSLFS